MHDAIGGRVTRNAPLLPLEMHLDFVYPDPSHYSVCTCASAPWRMPEACLNAACGHVAWNPIGGHHVSSKSTVRQRHRFRHGSCARRRTGGVARDAAEGGRAAREALALAPHRHDQLLQRDAVQARGQVRVPARPHTA